MTGPATPPPSPKGVDLRREGSGFDAARERRASTRWTRRLRQWLSWHLVGVLAVVIPVLYKAYCWFVWKTSRVDDDMIPRLKELLHRHGRVVGFLWHEEVFTVAYAYREAHGHTLASAGNFGRIITHMLEACNYVVFRGGSSAGSARRRKVLPLMLRHMRVESRPIVYGITCDGSNGPVYQMKAGGLLLAKACRTPIVIVRTWYSRRLQLPTWDRTGIPLPFNRIRMRCVGPYWIDPAGGRGELVAVGRHIQAELLDLCALSYREADGPAAGDGAQPGFPEGWTPRWPRSWDFAPSHALGLKRTDLDLRPISQPPPWASVPGPQSFEGDPDPEGEDDEGPG
jgi:lysophospholipid acyltransferase (LPLAT)-like uncharacterized protein